MLNIGQQLYDLTLRDQQTSFIDPYFRGDTGTAAIGSTSAGVNLSVPVDRCLFLHSIVFLCNIEAGTAWTSVQAAIGAAGGGYGIYRRSFGLVAGAQYQDTAVLNLLLPPGVGIIQLQANRLGTTALATAFLSINAYLIPPGRINRLF